MSAQASVFMQVIKQLFGLIAMNVKYSQGFPDVHTPQSQVRYSLPFDGSWTVVGGGITEETSHSWDVPTQRYAYDFLMFNDEGMTFDGDLEEPANYLCYGRDILAPADGVVVEVGTGCPNSRIDGKSAQCDGSDIRGNYVLIQHAENEFALMAHLKPGSTTVTVGQEVQRYDVVGRCGNSGMTSEPHLHFHVQDDRSFYTSAGLPIAFENIAVEPFSNYASVYERDVDEDAARSYPPYISKDLLVCNLPRA